MSDLCSRVVAFVDGELPTAEHQAFQDHLADCSACVRRIGDVWQVDASASRVLRAGPSTAVLALLVLLGALVVVALLLSSCAPGSPPLVQRAPLANVGEGFSRGRP